MEEIVHNILKEREHQIEKWGGVEKDKMHSTSEWQSFLIQYTGKAMSFPQDKNIFSENLIKVAALALAFGEAKELNRKALIDFSLERADTLYIANESFNTIIVKLARHITEIRENFFHNSILEENLIAIISIVLKSVYCLKQSN